MTPRDVSFRVIGKPATAGSKKVFTNKRTGKPIVVPDNDRHVPWRQSVQAAALLAMEGRDRIEAGPVLLDCVFVLDRPKSHYRTGKRAGELKELSPTRHCTKPDASKLVRAIEDAITGICWLDDNQVSQLSVRKRYAFVGEAPGAYVHIRRLDP